MVTGATGFLGSHLLCHLARCGETIIALKEIRATLKKRRLSFVLFRFAGRGRVPGDLGGRGCAGWGIRDPVCGKVDTVYHCAALVSFNGGDRNTLLETNIKGTENICKICLERVGYAYVL
ncbi:MAG: SDR family oxidoreductase [Butyricimonas faecalis]